MAKSRQELQRGKVERRRARIALMPKIPCACGCGTLIPPFDANLVARRYVKGHQNHVNPSPHTGKPAHNRIGDKPLTNTERSKRYLARRYKEIERLPKILCACGCGALIAPINRRLKKAMYANNHHRVGKKYPK